MIELERTFLAKEIPKDIKSFTAREIVDIYIPKKSHMDLRIRKNGEKYEMTRKHPVEDGDASIQDEQTISLEKEEFNVLSRVDGKKSRKVRYFKDYGKYTLEFDVYQDDLLGLVLVDFEFKTEKDKDSFKMPDFCLVDVTQEEFIAGGMLAGKSYTDLEPRLKEFGYSPLYLND